MSNPSGSYLYRTAHCAASQALPHVRSQSPDATRGSTLHRFLERAAQVGVEAALAEVPEEFRDAAEAVELEKLPLGTSHCQEVAYRFDLETGKAEVVGVGLGRRYGPRDDRYVYGTIDVDGSSEVADYKFEGFESNTEPMPQNHQLRFAALCNARVSGDLYVTARIYHIGPTGRVRVESHEFDSFALDEFEDELRAIIRRVREAEAIVARGETPSVSRGDWCRYCPALSACPAVVGLVRAVAAEPVRTAEEIRALLTPETARLAYQRLRDVEAALAPVKSALYLYASEFPIDLGDGRVYGPVETKRESIDARKARAVLAERFGPDVAEAACEFSTSKAAISRALREVAKAAKAAGEKVTQKALNEAALEQIAAAGGVRVEAKRAVRLHRAGKDGSVEVEPE